MSSLSPQDSYPVIELRDVNIYYEDVHVLKDVNLEINSKEVTAIIGPSGCGKSTLLKSIARLLDFDERCRVTGDIKVFGEDVYSKSVDVQSLRSQVVYVDQRPRLFAVSIYENISLSLHNWKELRPNNRSELDELVEKNLQRVGLWDEVKNRLGQLPDTLSAGQSQKLALARALCLEPRILLLDEPTANLDPVSISLFEEVIDELRASSGDAGRNFHVRPVEAVVMVTHNMQQAARVSQKATMMHLGNAVESASTDKIYTNPEDPRTESYITGRIG